jgi:hypothetical protein
MSTPSNEITVTNVRLSYVQVFGDGTVGDNGKKSWSLTALVKKESPQVLAITEAINAAKVKDAAKVGKSGIKSPLLDGDAKDEDGEYKYKGQQNRGHYMLRCANYNRRPTVVDQSVKPIIDPDQLYSGCFGNVRISFYGYNSGTNKGISPGLEAVQKVKDGERLANGPSDASSLFTAVEDDFLN